MTPPASTANFRGWKDLRLLARQVYYEQMTFWRNPIGAVFTVGFSVVFLVLLSSADGNSKVPGLDIHYSQYYTGAFAAYGVMSACFNMLTITLVVRRETGLLKRLRLSPLPTWAMIAGLIVNALVISLAQVVLLLAIGRLAYHVQIPSDLPALLLTLVVGVVCFTSLGLAAHTLVPNQEAAGPMTSIVFFVLLFLSGLWYAIPAGSGLAKFSAYFPVRHMLLATVAPFIPHVGSAAWAWHDLLVMALWGAGGIIVAARRFRFEPRRAG